MTHFKTAFVIFWLTGFNTLFAQFEIYLENTVQNIAGSFYTLNTENTDLIDLKFMFLNVSDSGGFKITRTTLSEPFGWSNALCWGLEGGAMGACYLAEEMNSNPWITPATVNIANQVVAELKIDVDPADAETGLAHYRYYIGRTAGDYLDSVDLIVQVNALAVPENTSGSLKVSCYPNPANDWVYVSQALQAQIQIIDSRGLVRLETSSSVINTSQLESGFYFLHLSYKEDRYVSRFLVQH